VNTFVCVYFGSGLLAILLTPLVIRLALYLRAVDRPGVRAVHRTPVPRIGGLAIFLSAVVMIVLVLSLNNVIGRAFRDMWPQLMTLLSSAAFVFLIGLVDDLKGLPARFKFLAELAAAGALCLVGVRINSIAITPDCIVHLGGWGCLLTLLWVVGITNAVNLSDGLDGLAAGVSAVACGVVAVLAVHNSVAVLAVLMLALAGSLCGFLIFNFNPAKVFMGDCGSLFVGFVIAASSILCFAKTAALVGLTLPALALAIPIFDTLFSMMRRFLDRRSLFAPDRGHFHHRLLDLGLKQRHAVLAIYLVTLLAAGLGLFMLVSSDTDSLILFGGVSFMIVLLFRAVGAVRLRETWARLRVKSAYSRQQREEQQAFENLQLRFRQVSGPAERWQAICEAAQRLDLAWVSLRVTGTSGGIDTSVWRRPQTPPTASRVITMNLPVNDARDNAVMEFEIAILVKGSLESASHRAGLFSRLVEEQASASPSHDVVHA
jgi:UDP-GlcNAc:undecaprenyl-phosphate GlcNAc-1-phosphate transferase